MFKLLTTVALTIALTETSAFAFVRVQIRAVDGPHPSWAVPVQAFFACTAEGWKLVGFERLPDGAARNTGTR